MVQTTAAPVVSASGATQPIPVAPIIPAYEAAPPGSEGQYQPRGPRPPLHSYTADEHDRYYCTITTLGSRGVMRDGCERYQAKFATSCDQ
jgi:hypothetical protein